MSTATRLFALSGPTITANSGFLVLGQNELIDIPVPVFLIEHPRGLVLFDTGLAPEAWEDDPRAVYGDLLDGLQIQFPPENSLERQFARYGFDFDDVTHVIVSHSHKDHTGVFISSRKPSCSCPKRTSGMPFGRIKPTNVSSDAKT
jgi:N-acyl homoserine lactone hydrolase